MTITVDVWEGNTAPNTFTLEGEIDYTLTEDGGYVSVFSDGNDGDRLIVATRPGTILRIRDDA